MHSNNFTYERIDSFLFARITWFKDYFFWLWYDSDDMARKYIVMSALCDFLQKKYLDNTMNIIWDINELDVIIKTLDDIYRSWDKKLQELVCVWFVENFLSSDMERMRKFKSILKYQNLVSCMVNLYKFWYKLDI